jgi:hypothetical protein
VRARAGARSPFRRSLLLSQEEGEPDDIDSDESDSDGERVVSRTSQATARPDDVDELLLLHLFGSYDEDSFWKIAAELLYTQHGGSGFSGLTLRDLEDIPVAKLEFLLEWLEERRQKEKEAIEQAARSR